jgi:hypothetical protein
MAWRVHLADDSIYRLDILKGKPDVLCAWFAGDRVAYYDLATGVALGRVVFDAPPLETADREGDAWTDFLATLRAPNGALLPLVRLPQLTIHQTTDGAFRLYDDGHGLTVHQGASETPLSAADTHLVTVMLNRETGTVAALDDRGKLYLLGTDRAPRIADIALQPDAHTVSELVLADEGGVLFASDGYRVVRARADGGLDRQRVMAYYVSRLACSPDGERCATSDAETGIIRIYQGPNLTFERQKFAIDLYAAADPVQLLEDMPTPRLAVSALALDGETLAFAMEGMITVTHLSEMEQMPQAQSPL